MRWHFGRPNGEGRKSLRGAWLGSRRRNKDDDPSREGYLYGAGLSAMKQSGSWWAMRGSNPRPSRCKRDALTN